MYSNFNQKAIIKKREKERECIYASHVIGPSGKLLCPTIQDVDSRLKSEIFRQKVRLVMGYFGIQNNGKNFKKYDKIIDWNKTAKNIECPVFAAVVKPLWNGTPIDCREYVIELHGITRADALKKLDKQYYLFKEWLQC